MAGRRVGNYMYADPRPLDPAILFLAGFPPILIKRLKKKNLHKLKFSFKTIDIVDSYFLKKRPPTHHVFTKLNIALWPLWDSFEGLMWSHHYLKEFNV